MNIELRKRPIEGALIALATAKANEKYRHSVNIEGAVRRLQSSVKLYVTQCIEDDAEDYRALQGLNTSELLSVVSGYDEIRAYFATNLLCQDLDGLTQDELTRLWNMVEIWKRRYNLLSTQLWGFWYSQSSKLKKHRDELLTCYCGQTFNSFWELERHQSPIIKASYVGVYRKTSQCSEIEF